MTYFLDTNTCIFYLKGKFPAIHRKILEIPPNRIKIPSMVAAELIFGAQKSLNTTQNMEKIGKFLKPLEIVPFGSDAAYFYGKIRAVLEKTGMIIGFNDMVIAATVLAQNGILVTNNTGEFLRVEGLILEDWASD